MFQHRAERSGLDIRLVLSIGMLEKQQEDQKVYYRTDLVTTVWIHREISAEHPKAPVVDRVAIVASPTIAYH